MHWPKRDYMFPHLPQNHTTVQQGLRNIRLKQFVGTHNTEARKNEGHVAGVESDVFMTSAINPNAGQDTSALQR